MTEEDPDGKMFDLMEAENGYSCAREAEAYTESIMILNMEDDNAYVEENVLQQEKVILPGSRQCGRGGIDDWGKHHFKNKCTFVKSAKETCI
eukprot:14351152-Ditylum_brightwellii.AAC.1